MNSSVRFLPEEIVALREIAANEGESVTNLLRRAMNETKFKGGYYSSFKLRYPGRPVKAGATAAETSQPVEGVGSPAREDGHLTPASPSLAEPQTASEIVATIQEG